MIGPILVIAVGVVGGLALLTVLIVVIIKRNRPGSAKEQRDDRTAQVEGYALETRSHRSNVQATGFVNYEALVRYAGPDRQAIEAWLPVYLPPRGWQVPGQRVLIACNPANARDAHVERAI